MYEPPYPSTYGLNMCVYVCEGVFGERKKKREKNQSY